MSNFCLGGKPEKVPAEALLPEMREDRYFKPGIIHGGEDYLIRVYLSDLCEPYEQFSAEYLSSDLILKAHYTDRSHGRIFDEILAEECESFACDNDGSSGEFAALVKAWPKSVGMSRSDLAEWAHRVNGPGIDRNDLPEFLGEAIDLFEDFLEEKGISIPNSEKDDDPDNTAIIYGSDYGLLQSSLEELLINWNLTEGEVL